MTAVTADCRADERTARLLALLDELPQRRPGGVISGVFMKQGVDELHAATEKWPALLGVEYCSSFGINAVETPEQTIDWRKLNPDLVRHAHAGGLIRILTHFHNPCNEKYGGLRDSDADIDAILTEGTPQRGRWLAMLDEAARGFKDLENQGVSVIYGPLHEHNCSGFWWGLINKSPKMTPEKFKAMWRDIFTTVCERHDCHNVLWLWPPLGNDPIVMEAYPGDEYVDLVGMDVYAPSLAPYVAGYQQLIDTGKPFILSEFGGCYFGCPEEDTRKYDCRKLLDEIEQYWPLTRAFMFWSGEYSPPENRHAREMMHDGRVLDRADVSRLLDENEPQPIGEATASPAIE